MLQGTNNFTTSKLNYEPFNYPSSPLILCFLKTFKLLISREVLEWRITCHKERDGHKKLAKMVK
uniref:Uncharacterized protein n=1 Tax=Lepeophtheirus salmonis TaxID=72036 RepID=A0A0K2T611_LEPSM